MEVTGNVTDKEEFPYIYRKKKDKSIRNTDFLITGKRSKKCNKRNKRNKRVANISSIRYNKTKGMNVRQNEEI